MLPLRSRWFGPTSSASQRSGARGAAGAAAPAAAGARGEIALRLAPSLKFLGVIIAHTLLWDEHIAKVVRNANGYRRRFFGPKLEPALPRAGLGKP